MTRSLQHPPRPRERAAIKAWNRRKIIDATIAVINARGIAGTTIARVVELAQVSMGLVNLHFGSKEGLLEAVLRDMAGRYDAHWRQALAAAADDAGARIRALALADLDPAVLNRETLGVWYAFRAQARSGPLFVALVGNRDRELSARYAQLFARLNRKSGRDHPPDTVTRGLIAMLEGIWADFFLYPEEFERAAALGMLTLYLDSLYPALRNRVQALPSSAGGIERTSLVHDDRTLALEPIPVLGDHPVRSPDDVLRRAVVL